MKRIVALALLLAGIATAAGGCVFVPIPVWDGHGHHHHREW
jgi:hypothetical protein